MSCSASHSCSLLRALEPKRLEPKWLRTPPLRNGMKVFFFFFFFCSAIAPGFISAASRSRCSLGQKVSACHAARPTPAHCCEPSSPSGLSQNGYGPPRYVTA
mmetsp:Transcript_1331/g.815  ORF Transcript_1331/g.815 Transcript_1331/m.815 type:complete len:102 (-) Transcript_1331:27-332(-)